VAEFIDDDLSGSRFDGVRMHHVRMRRVDLTGLEVRGALLRDTRLIGVDLHRVEITGELVEVTVNGIDIGPLVEAELDRREPDRVKMRPTDPAGFAEAWALLAGLWDDTVRRARSLPAEQLDRHVAGEWSFIQTLRHLNFATAAWVGRGVLGDPMPYHPLDLPWDEAPHWPEIELDREARPSLDEVLRVRHERRAMATAVIRALTHDRLAETVCRPAPGWPVLDDFPVADCLRIVLNEEWEHRRYAERDLAVLAARG
jgi:hypothetical protein